jgi:hypothetical protein
VSEIQMYPYECAHRQERERCWQCLTTENVVLSDALRTEKERVAALAASARAVLDVTGERDRMYDSTLWQRLEDVVNGVAPESKSKSGGET